MLLLGSQLIGYKVLSLQTGQPIATTSSPIIDPTKLKIIAYSLQGPLVDKSPENTLRIDDIREFSSIGMIIDSIDELVNPSDIIKISEAIKLGFKLINHKVITIKGKKIGKVVDYTVDSGSFSIYQLIVRRPLVQSLNDPELTINRSQIVEVDDYKITIKNDSETVGVAGARSGSPIPGFVNPFRQVETPAPVEPSDVD